MSIDIPTLDTPIRKLLSNQLSEIAKILDQDDCWKKVMAVVPNYDSDNQDKPLFKPEHIGMIEQTTKMEQRIAAEVFLTEWGSIGKQRPTCRTLLEVLVKTKLFRAADYLSDTILKIDRPERPKTGPAAPVDVSDALVEALLKQQMNASKNTEPSTTEQAWLMQIQEKPKSVTAENNPDLIKSDLIQFSKTASKILEQKPEDMSDLIKFSHEVSASNIQTEDFALPEAPSENIPLCVKEDMFQFDRTASSVNENSATNTTINSSDISRAADTEEEIDLPQVSERFIPVVVLEYTDKSDS